jgi:hypothetical protein
MSSDDKLEVVDISEVKNINDNFIKDIDNKLSCLLSDYKTLSTTLEDIHKLLLSKTEEIENVMGAIQMYSGSIHIAMNKTSSSIDVINNIINTVGMPRNNSSQGASKNNNSNISNSSSIVNGGYKITKRKVSINVLFSYVFRLFEGDEVNEAPDLASIIEKYESNNKINLRETMDINSLFDENDKAKFDEGWNKLKKESEKTPKRKATLVWTVIKQNKEFHKKFESFKNYYAESSENKE